jgi:DNA invertase Pin-like site-specific DNA recombinase
MPTYGYVRGTTDPRVESPEVQKQIIADYASRRGLLVDGIFVDRAAAGGQPLIAREAGGQLLLALRKGDHLIAARLDRVSRSLLGFGTILEALDKLGVVVHLCDVPGGVLDPKNRYCSMLTRILVAFARHDRRMLGQRASRALAARRAAGERYTRVAPYGYRWQRRGKKTFIVAAHEEQAIIRQAVEMRAQGYSYHQIREYLAFEWKVRNRRGNEFGYREVRTMITRGTQLRSQELVGA